MTGQDLITTSIIAMENFLSNNVLFEDTDDIITFITNVKQEKYNNDILNFVDEPITKDELFEYLTTHVKPDSKIENDIILSYCKKLDLEMTTQIYYKNQLDELLMNNSWFKNKLGEMLKYKYTDKPDEELLPLLDDFREKIIEFCFYDHLYEDRYKRSMKDKRKTIITIDTDSNFINGDKYVKLITKLLNLDRENSVQQGTIINIIINITTEALRRTFWTLTTNMGLIDRAKPIINMKQEFLYKRIMLTNNKKNLKNRK